MAKLRYGDPTPADCTPVAPVCALHGLVRDGPAGTGAPFRSSHTGQFGFGSYAPPNVAGAPLLAARKAPFVNLLDRQGLAVCEGFHALPFGARGSVPRLAVKDSGR